MERFQHSLEAEEVLPTIISLQAHLEVVRRTELDRARRRLGSLRSEQKDAIEELTRGIVTRILHAPSMVLEAVTEEKESAALVRMVHCIFNLGDRPA